MKYSALFVFFLSLLFFSTTTFAQNEEAAQLAQKQADAWVKVVDEGKYAESWEKASPLFQQSVTQAQWEQAARQVRDPLGELKSRELNKAEYTTTLPKAPEGEYVVVEYTASFANRDNATETVILSKTEEDGWATVGYFIQ